MFEQLRNNAVIKWIAIMLLVISPLVLYFYVGRMSSNVRQIAFIVESVLVYLLLFSALLHAVLQTRNTTKRMFWGWLMLFLSGIALIVAGNLWYFLDEPRTIFSFASSVDLVYFFFYLFFLIAMIVFSAQKFTMIEWFKRVFDVSIVLITMFLGFWICLFKPILVVQSNPFSNTQILMLAYPLADMVLIFSILAAIYFKPRIFSAKSLWILLVGICILTVSDYYFSTKVVLDPNFSDDLINVGWWYSTFLFAVAAFSQSDYAKKFPNSTKPGGRMVKFFTNWLTYFPFLLIIVAYVLFIYYHNSPLEVSNELLIGVGVIIGLVLIRQLIVLSENKALLHSLSDAMDHLKRQKKDVDRTNQDLLREIEERNLIQEKLSYDSMHDPLTGLSNRVLFTNRLEHAFEKNKRKPVLDYSVLFLDLDNFKSINDVLGHIAGDLALVELGHRLGKCIRAVDTLARFGGDEFVILLENAVDKNVTLSVANRILAELQRPFLHNENKVVVTCSIGIVQSIRGYHNPEEVLRDVDIAMYTAKKTGKDKFEIFNIEMGSAATYQLEVEGELHRAITNKELFLQYQPVFNLKTNTISGFEALLRWQHPMRGLLEPDDFIPIAEDSGAINLIGDWVVKAACGQMKQWHDLYPESHALSISINFAGKQILKNSAVKTIQNILNETNLDPNRLRLEITENTLIMDHLAIKEKISELREMGIAISVDDFGTGYSSLFNLHNFTIDEIKIDKAFAEGISEGKTNFEICKAIIQMAKQLDITTVVEGIEQEEQLQIFRSLDCDFGQGYFLARPMSAQEISETYLR